MRLLLRKRLVRVSNFIEGSGIVESYLTFVVFKPENGRPEDISEWMESFQGLYGTLVSNYARDSQVETAEDAMFAIVLDECKNLLSDC